VAPWELRKPPREILDLLIFFLCPIEGLKRHSPELLFSRWAYMLEFFCRLLGLRILRPFKVLQLLEGRYLGVMFFLFQRNYVPSEDTNSHLLAKRTTFTPNQPQEFLRFSPLNLLFALGKGFHDPFLEFGKTWRRGFSLHPYHLANLQPWIFSLKMISAEILPFFHSWKIACEAPCPRHSQYLDPSNFGPP